MLQKNNFRTLAALLMVVSVRVLPAQTAAPAQAAAKDLAAFEGRVVNGANGHPLAGVQVRIVSISETRRRYMGLSGADGGVLIGSIAPGEYSISMFRQGYSEDHPASGLPKADLSRHRFTPGESFHGVLSMLPDPVITGRVVDSAGTPMEQVPVAAMGAGTLNYTRTDDRGEFRMVMNQPGPYLVKATPDRHEPPEIRKDGTTPRVYGLTYFRNSRSPESAATVTAQAGQESSVEIKLEPAPAAQVSGTVYGLPAGEKATLWLTGVEEIKTFTDQEGRFAFWRVPAGHYRLEASAGGRRAGAGSDETPLTGRLMVLDVESASIAGLHLEMTPPVNLRLKFRDADWEKHKDKIGNVSVILRGAKLNKQGSPDDKGELSIEKLAPGSYHVLTNGLPGDLCIKSLRPAEGQVTKRILEVSSAPEQQVVLELGTDGARISGVVRTQTGEATQAEVALLDDEDPDLVEVQTAVAKADGHYSFQAVAPGKYRLLAYTPKGGGSSLRMELPGFYEGIIKNPETKELFRKAMEKIEVGAGEQATKELKID